MMIHELARIMAESGRKIELDGSNRLHIGCPWDNISAFESNGSLSIRCGWESFNNITDLDHAKRLIESI